MVDRERQDPHGETRSQRASSPTSPQTSAPRFIGPYRVIQKIGEGGMGEVFEAQQDSPVRRRVALKVIKPGLETKQVLARFEAERQALALMEHPSVAKVFDAGETDRGLPYFAMEYVQGVPITEHCDRHRLTTRERLELFIPVCEGIQHAHQKAVIHRDIKPTNVLVAIQDGKAVPKIIDFGVAKAIAQPLTERTLFTEMGQLIGTPAYMSPEQAEMTGQNVDTRTDVYSLGAMLYELLVGTAPFDPTILREAGLDGIRRTIREIDPPRPSTRVSSLGEESETSARNRRTAIRALSGQLRGDLDWITMKALEKDCMRRYQSALELARDIERHLRDEPVEAGPPSRAYRLRKFAVRHKATLAFTASLFVVLMGFGVWMSVLYGREEGLRRAAEESRAEALARAEELELVTEFQGSMLSGIDAEEMGKTLLAELRSEMEESIVKGGASPEEAEAALADFDRIVGQVNATNLALLLVDQQVLGRAVEAIEAEFDDQPLVRASLQQTVASTYRDLGLYSRAVPLQEAALDTRRRELGDDDLETLGSVHEMGALLDDMGRFEEALVHYREATEGFRRLLGDEDLLTLTSMNNTGLTLRSMGKLDEALIYYREVLDGCRRVLGEDHPHTLGSMNNMSMLLRAMGKRDEALRYQREALEGCRRALGPDHPLTLTSMNNLANVLEEAGQLDEALGHYREVLEIRRRVLGDDHPHTLASIGNMGTALRSMGRVEEAFDYYQEVMDGSRRVLGEDHPSTLTSIHNMGRLHESLGQPEEALNYYLQALDAGRRVQGNDHPSTLITVTNIGYLLHEMGKLDEGLLYFREAVEGYGRVLGEEHPSTLWAIIGMGNLLLDQGEAEEVAALLSPREAAARRTLTGSYLPRLGVFLTALGRSLAATGEFGSAREKLNEGHATLREAPGAKPKDTERVLNALAALHEAWHVVEPNEGHDLKAVEWRTKLEELRAEPAGEP